MPAVEDSYLETIGLGGDGDEVDAVLAVESHFGISLDYQDARHWVTAGDVFASLLRALPPDRRNREEVWPAFASIMCEETGADASQLGQETLLLALPLRVVVERCLNRLLGSSR